ncbi:hypothetical protein ATE84_4912 [Aquimarina sp. MAR_2010_214]|uniref:hypothetical protein n=1 Tax=Aquimarina sp. MAR_2010_214 TaxID=1250026 RepID=UPI000C7101DA|nr:hypothetical protein [Aquimarina sp. MAR_2010_214]PKV52785.1 hypothetical protein ATE84_4912 [Aquimarina sp. MAR_2010_214]
MTNSIFHNKEFKINGISIPEFELKNGNLIRIYIPNFDAKNLPLGFDLAIELIKRFQNQKTDFPWAKNYRQHTVMELLNSLTVNKYLINKMRIDKSKAKKIAEEIGISLKDKFEHLSFTNRKALIIKALFDKNDSVILDYYGVDANGIRFLERLVNSEIENDKSAIAFDRFEFKANQEPFQNIIPIEIKNCIQHDICDHNKQLEF